MWNLPCSRPMAWPDPDIQIGGDGTTEAWRILLRSVLRMVGCYILSYVSTLFRVHFSFCVQSICRTSKLVQSSCCSEGSYLIFIIKGSCNDYPSGKYRFTWVLKRCSSVPLLSDFTSQVRAIYTNNFSIIVYVENPQLFYKKWLCHRRRNNNCFFFKLLLNDYQCYILTSYLSVHPPFYEAGVILNTITLVISIYRAVKLLGDERVHKRMPITRVIYHFFEHLGLENMFFCI